MEVVLVLSCQNCQRVLHREKVSVSVGSEATIYVDTVLRSFGNCCNMRSLFTRATIRQAEKVVESGKAGE